MAKNNFVDGLFGTVKNFIARSAAQKTDSAAQPVEQSADKATHDLINKNYTSSTSLKTSLETLSRLIGENIKSEQWHESWKGAKTDDIFDTIRTIQVELEKPISITRDIAQLDDSIQMMIEALEKVGYLITPDAYRAALNSLLKIVSTRRRSGDSRDVQMASLELLIPIIEWERMSVSHTLDVTREKMTVAEAELTKAVMERKPLHQLTATFTNLSADVDTLTARLQQLDEKKRAMEEKLNFLRNHIHILSNEKVNEILTSIDEEQDTIRHNTLARIKEDEELAIRASVKAKEWQQEVLFALPTTTQESIEEAQRQLYAAGKKRQTTAAAAETTSAETSVRSEEIHSVSLTEN